MHIRITVSSSYCKYIYSSDIPKYYNVFGLNFKEEQNDIKFQN